MSNPGPIAAWTVCDWCGEAGDKAVYCGCGDGPFHTECLGKHVAVDHGGAMTIEQRLSPKRFGYTQDGLHYGCAKCASWDAATGTSLKDIVCTCDCHYR